MPASRGPVEQFLAFVRRRVNTHRLWTAAIWAVAAGAGLLVAVGLPFVLRGYAVPGGWIAASLAIAALGGALGWLWSRLSEDQSARFVDRFYNLQDSVASYLHFSRSGRRDGYYALQAEYTQRKLAGLKAEEIRYRPPRRGMLLAAGLAAVALPLSLRGPSAAVLEQMERETALVAATETANNELKDLVEELKKGTDDPQEKELLNPDKLRKWVDSLKTTKDQKEALRQYAELERELNKARAAIERKKDEQLLQRAAEKLQEQRETAPLGEQLQQKKYDKAADELASMTPPQDKKLSEQRKELARLKAATQRMAAAARANRSASQGKESKAGNKSQSNSGESNDANAGSGSSAESGASFSGSGGGELSQNLEELANSVEQLDDSLKDAEKQEKELGKCESQCKECQNKVDSQLKKLCNCLKKLSITRKADKKLCLLCQKCSQCQSQCNSACACNSPNAGGKKAGMGTNSARREERDRLVDNGQTTQLKGVKGNGPSLTTVEAADDGSGVSTRRGAAKEREFKRQFESFVEREDVPAEVRQGVKNYFQLIHQMEEQPTAEKK